MSPPGMVLSALAAAVGALMYWVITYQNAGLRFSTVGVVLMIVGAFGFVISVIIFTDSKRPARASQFSSSRPDLDAEGMQNAVNEDAK